MVNRTGENFDISLHPSSPAIAIVLLESKSSEGSEDSDEDSEDDDLELTHGGVAHRRKSGSIFFFGSESQHEGRGEFIKLTLRAPELEPFR